MVSQTKTLRRDDPRCGVIPNACGALIRFKFIQERNLTEKIPFKREKQKSF